MAKQMEGFIEGTYDDITFYKMEGKYYARMKSSLTGKIFWKHKSFEGSRRSCCRFGRGNQLASLVYNEIDEMTRKYKTFCAMKRMAIALIKRGEKEEKVVEELRRLKVEVVVKDERTEVEVEVESEGGVRFVRSERYSFVPTGSRLRRFNLVLQSRKSKPYRTRLYTPG